MPEDAAGMWRWLCLLTVVACGDNVVPSALPLAEADELIVVAHQDDDLLFMEPDLADMLAMHVPVTTVYVTAGDGGNGISQANERMAAIRAAYGVVAGSQDWTCDWIELADQPAQHCRLAAASVSIVELGLPDGGVNDSAPQAILHLFEGTADHADTVADRPARYTRDTLIEALAEVVDATKPRTIRTLDISATHGVDHPDHQIVGTLAVLARAAAHSDAQLVSYRGYNINGEPAMISDAMLDAASLPMRAYEACALGCGPCGSGACPTLSDPRYAGFVRRHYATASRVGPLTGMLHGDGGCLHVAPDHPLAFGTCDDATPLTFERDGRIRAGDTCLELDETGEVIAVADCTPDARRTFLLDDSGHLWAGTPADSTKVTVDMNATCLASIEGELSGVVCGEYSAPTWRVERPLSITPHDSTGLGATARNVRIADLTGDGHGDLCAVTASGLECAPGDGAGGFGRAHRIDAAAKPLRIVSQSLALGDVDGDGVADACGATPAGAVCATSSSGYGVQAAAVPMPSSCVPSSLAIADRTMCALDPAGLVCAHEGATRAVLVSAWPRAHSTAVGDLDGDGLPDWCSATDAGPACGLAADDATTTDGLSWGYAEGGVAEGAIVLDGHIADAARALGDVTGDGRADACELVGQRVLCAASEGHAFGPRSPWLELPDSLKPTALWLGDLDGDGKLDVCVDTANATACALSP